ncbi:hypothetical protein NDU88_001610 [Pleurodeles waltl]|uniref:Uncharacterized protein n=1 Tax=Pleurodeles waltl TaxID=8319 RepID=A0AAV7LHX3_PLEWA|nr:hypothetical protein NDU88_001610 [Pleurodeles waltl]
MPGKAGAEAHKRAVMVSIRMDTMEGYEGSLRLHSGNYVTGTGIGTEALGNQETGKKVKVQEDKVDEGPMMGETGAKDKEMKEMSQNKPDGKVVESDGGQEQKS